MNIQSSSPHFPTIFAFVTRRRITIKPLIIIKDKPTVKMSGAKEGGSRKFGGSPFGLAAKEVLDGSTLGGRDAIARSITQKGKERFDPRGVATDKCLSFINSIIDRSQTMTTRNPTTTYKTSNGSGLRRSISTDLQALLSFSGW